MQRWAGRVALVTGSSAGIGCGIARALVKHGLKVVGCAENDKEVQRIEAVSRELKGEEGSLVGLKCDMGKEEDILKMFETIKSDPNLRGVDVCINNAGLAHEEPFLTGQTEAWRQMIDINILGYCICTREAFKSMKERGIDDGHIFLINSVAGHRVPIFTNIHFYSMTKFAVTAMSEAIRFELREMKSGIRISSISPGVVETEFAYKMIHDPVRAKATFTQYPCLQPDDLADAVIYALQAPPHVQVHDIMLRPTMQFN
ncbi:dehydrogenase/reductase SDR family member 11-like [Gigantopelta aegis]|uniref:dehydrogenase/reductase SDR family member 11-like n=1 Tax=Gigantopelta aegis TaxID=1735272 RepID=UPI001B88CA68|nr:dehydrogenase/reductase SDR family member 11-like [Gigantopelta aegis]